MRLSTGIFIALLLFGLGSLAFIYSGIYRIGADVPHTGPVYWTLETLRDNSIESASRKIVVPPLADPDLLLAGGTDYNEMCAGCHLKPGRAQSDIFLGLYPSPPNLSLSPFLHGTGDDFNRAEGLARKRFWIIKHGIKASGMPAWGLTHDDQRIWAMVAFLQRLPDLTPTQYQVLTARGGLHENH